MKVVYWNVRTSIANRPKKQEKLLSFAEDADVIILAEAEEPGYKDRNYDFIILKGYEYLDRAGKIAERGLIAFAKPGVINKDAVKHNDNHYSLVLPLNNSDVTIVGVWSKSRLKTDTRTNDYCYNMQNCLNETVKFLVKPIVVGDFNMSPKVSGQKIKAPRIFKEFEAAGLNSLYHQVSCEKYGEETNSSYWDGNGGFMLDHVFAKNGTVKKAIWPFEDKEYWAGKYKSDECSDHLPIIIEL